MEECKVVYFTDSHLKTLKDEYENKPNLLLQYSQPEREPVKDPGDDYLRFMVLYVVDGNVKVFIDVWPAWPGYSYNGYFYTSMLHSEISDYIITHMLELCDNVILKYDTYDPMTSTRYLSDFPQDFDLSTHVSIKIDYGNLKSSLEEIEKHPLICAFKRMGYEIPEWWYMDDGRLRSRWLLQKYYYPKKNEGE